MAKKRRRNTSWKQAERRVAAFFGCKRTILSGSLSRVRDHETNSDTDHADLFIEIKQREKHGTWSWFREAKNKSLVEAKRTGKPSKIAVLALDELRAKGAIICVHSDDLAAFCRLFLSLQKNALKRY